jgi:hypothetical protein
LARIAGVNIPTNKLAHVALTYIHGIGRNTADQICESVGVDRQRRVNELSDAESAAEIQAARLMTLDAARVMDQGDEARVEISLIKFWGARVLHDVIDRAIQVHGALGVTGDTPLEFMYREARYARLYDGPDEVHRMVVARRLLKDVGRAPWA